MQIPGSPLLDLLHQNLKDEGSKESAFLQGSPMVLMKAQVFERFLSHFCMSVVSECSGLFWVVWLGAAAKAIPSLWEHSSYDQETNQSVYTELSYAGAIRYPSDSVAFPRGWGRCESKGSDGVCGTLDREYHTCKSPNENNCNKKISQWAGFSVLTASCNSLV